MTNPYKIMKITNLYKTPNKNYAAGYHTGVDLVGESSKNIKAITNGSIHKTGYDNSYGNYMTQKIVRNGKIKYVWYCHLSRILKLSGNIKEGEIIAIEGATGNATGSHLHLELRNSTNQYGQDEDICALLNIENKIETVQELKVTTNGSNLNVRKTPEMGDNIVGSYKNGTIVNVFEIKDGWGRTNKGWCSMQYLK